MKYQSYIYDSHRRPFIGPRQSPNKGKQVATVLALSAGIFATAWAITWLAIELKKLS